MLGLDNINFQKTWWLCMQAVGSYLQQKSHYFLLHVFYDFFAHVLI